MKKVWYMCAWTLISHVTGLGTWLLHYWLLKYNICQHWESKYQKFSLDCPFSQKAQNFPQRSVQPCFKIWAVVRKWSHHPPPVSCATLLAKVQIQEEKNCCLNTKPLLPPTPSCAPAAILAEPSGHHDRARGLSESSTRAGSDGKAIPSRPPPQPWVILSWWRHCQPCAVGAGGRLGWLKTASWQSHLLTSGTLCHRLVEGFCPGWVKWRSSIYPSLLGNILQVEERAPGGSSQGDFLGLCVESL